MRRYGLLVIALMLLCQCSVCVAKPRQMSLQIREGTLRATPSFLGGVVASAAYGDRLTVLEEQGAWSKVSPADGGAAGWIHTSALTKKRITLKAGDKDAEVAASSGELALAGKGFNSEVEAEFKSQNKDVDFAWIDRMEAITVSVEQVKTFLKDGKVAPKGGAE